jgi:hypothetical protein
MSLDGDKAPTLDKDQIKGDARDDRLTPMKKTQEEVNGHRNANCYILLKFACLFYTFW